MLAPISLAFSKSSQIGPNSSNHLKTVETYLINILAVNVLSLQEYVRNQEASHSPPEPVTTDRTTSATKSCTAARKVEVALLPVKAEGLAGQEDRTVQASICMMKKLKPLKFCRSSSVSIRTNCVPIPCFPLPSSYTM